MDWVYVYLNNVYSFSMATTKYKTDGQLTVLKDPSGIMEAEAKDSISFKLAKRNQKDSLRRGMVIHAQGKVAKLGKNTVFYIQDWEIIRQSSIRKMFSKTAVDGERLRDGQLTGTKGTVCDLPDVYTQDVRDVHELFRKAGFRESPETAWMLVSFFSQRAKQRGFEGVVDLIASNPFIIAETEEFSITDAKRLAKNLGVNLPIEIEAMAVVAQIVASNARRGNTFIPTPHVAVQTKGDKAMMELAKKSKDTHPSIIINRLLISSFRDVMKQGGAKVTISGKKECGEEAARYYSQVAETLGENFAEKSNYYGNAAASGIYMTGAYFAERTAAELFANRIGDSNNGYSIDLGLFKDIPLSGEQEQALKNAIAYKTSVVVGQAGTGKTHIIKALVSYCQAIGKRVKVIAPSAMAAAVAGGKANLRKEDFQTIHRFANITHMTEDLGVNDFLPRQGDMENLFEHTDMIVVDEMSLCSVMVFSRLLHSIKQQPQLHLVIMGDPGQLPAIGPSGFFHQMAARVIDPSLLPVTELKTVFRTEGRELLEAALQVRNEHSLEIRPTEAVQLIERDKEALYREIAALLENGIKHEDILVISDQRKEEMGTMQLNAFLRTKLNEKGKRIDESAGSFAVGDPVIATQNDYAEYAEDTTGRRKIMFFRHEGRTEDVFNGMRGTIVGETGTGITVRWNDPDHEISPYTYEEISCWIEPAYAISIHKAQGSEADYVFVVPASEKSRINQNMMYTAITRAQKRVYLIGDESIWTTAAGKIQMAPYSKFGFLVNQALEETKWKNRKTKDASTNRFQVVMDF